jgi:uncharacterized protein YjbI with pentapeptide repeats
VTCLILIFRSQISLGLTFPKLTYHTLTSQATLFRATLPLENLSNAILVQTKMENALLAKADLTGADLSDADLSNATLNKANLMGSKLIHADLEGVEMIDANLQKAILSNSNLSGVNLIRCNIENAKLPSSILIGCSQYYDLVCTNADFREAVIDNESLVEYLRDKKARNVPDAIKERSKLQKILESRGYNQENVNRILSYSSTPPNS